MQECRVSVAFIFSLLGGPKPKAGSTKKNKRAKSKVAKEATI